MRISGLFLSIVESDSTLEFFSGGYSDRTGGQGGRGGSEHKGTGKEERGHEADKGKRALASKVGVVTPQMKPLVLIRVLAEKCRGAEGEVFVCLGQTVLRKRVDESVKLSKVVGGKRNGLASMMVTSAKSKAGVGGSEGSGGGGGGGGG